jgi:hypothetical protein
MTKALTRDQESELESLRVACLSILDYFAPSGALGPLEAQFRAGVETAYLRRDLRELRGFRRDFQVWLRDLPADARAELEMKIAPPPKDLERVLARGRIDSENEYRAVLARVEELYDDPARDPDVIRLNSLLTEYDIRPPSSSS